MSESPKSAGLQGELVAKWSLVRQGWRISGEQVLIHGHRLDLLAIHPATGHEWMVEVKVWGPDPSGRDTVKKALADAYDLREAGETRPYLLVLSHSLEGLHGEMIARARKAGVLGDVQLIGLTPLDNVVE